jgi:hypothetical protein
VSYNKRGQLLGQRYFPLSIDIFYDIIIEFVNCSSLSFVCFVSDLTLVNGSYFPEQN